MDALEQKVEAADRGELEPPPAPPGDAAQPGVTQGDAAQPGAPGAGLVDESAKWIEAALYYGDVVRELVPERARPHWTDERLRKLGEALARCASHYGWSFGALITHPLGMLAAAAFPLAWPIAAPYVAPLIKKATGGAVQILPDDAAAAAAAAETLAREASAGGAPSPSSAPPL